LTYRIFDQRIPPEPYWKPTIVAPQMPHDVFISDSSAGKLTANAICNQLESTGIRCWILPRDLDVRLPCDQSIANAVASCRIMIVVFTDYAYRSDRIERQLEGAFHSGAIIIPFRIESTASVSLSESHLDSEHWLDVLTPEMGTRLRSLCGLVRRLLLRERHDAPVLSTLMIGESSETRRRPLDPFDESHPFRQRENDEQLSSDDAAAESPDSGRVGNRQSSIKQTGESEQEPTDTAKSSRRQPPQTSRMRVIKALVLILAPLLLVLGVGFWHTRTGLKSGLSNPRTATSLPAGQVAADKIRTEEKFAAWDRGWGIPDANWSVKDGKLRITPSPNSSTLLINQTRGFKDAEVAVDVAMSKGEDLGQLGGLIFWAKGYSDCYAMVISADGKFAVGRKLVGRWINPIAKTASTAVKTGIGQINKLRIRIQGKLLTAYINEIQVATLVGEPPQSDGFVGLYGESAETSQNIWDFTNVTVIGAQ
jgi:hypothetical protein